jgi:NADH pyrophosphatase NudC (nudix superfamily)
MNYCVRCGHQLVGNKYQYGLKLKPPPVISMKKNQGFATVFHQQQNEAVDNANGKSKFTLYENNKTNKKFVVTTTPAMKSEKVLLEGLAYYLDQLKPGIKIDIYTSNAKVADQVNERAMPPKDEKLRDYCEAIRQFLKKRRTVTIQYMPEKDLKTAIRVLEPKAKPTFVTLKGEALNGMSSSRFCTGCGKLLNSTGNSIHRFCIECGTRIWEPPEASDGGDGDDGESEGVDSESNYPLPPGKLPAPRRGCRGHPGL